MSEWIRENLISANLRGLPIVKKVPNKSSPIREYAKRVWKGVGDGYGSILKYKENIRETSFEKANLVLSKTVDGDHAPIFDFDFPCALIESSTEGHYHLYIQATISWEDYKDILEAFRKAGLLEDGWVKAALVRGYAALRKPELEIKKAFDALNGEEETLYRGAYNLEKEEIHSKKDVLRITGD